MISREMLEEMQRDLRKRYFTFTSREQRALNDFYEGKFELLEILIAIAKEAKNERQYTRDNVCKSGQDKREDPES